MNETRTDQPVTGKGNGAPIVSRIIDFAVVLAFVAVGRSSHQEELTLASVLQVARPFVFGLLIGWVIVRVTKIAPMNSLLAGAIVWFVTVLVGFTYRGFDKGAVPPQSFMITAGIFLGVFLLGWRAIASVITYVISKK